MPMEPNGPVGGDGRLPVKAVGAVDGAIRIRRMTAAVDETMGGTRRLPVEVNGGIIAGRRRTSVEADGTTGGARGLPMHAIAWAKRIPLGGGKTLNVAG